MVRAGRVSVNGVIQRNPEFPVNMDSDRIKVDGRLVAEKNKVYLLLNKPRGIVTTASDEKGRKTVYDFLRDHPHWVAPVGRLDQASEGLLLFTNDSEWGARIAAPETHLEKTYHVRVKGNVDAGVIGKLIKGVLNDGELLRARHATVVRRGVRHSWLEIVLDEGRNRQIRRMFEELNIEVVRLIRIAIGPLPLGDLAKGQSRALTQSEKESLDRAIARRTPAKI